MVKRVPIDTYCEKAITTLPKTYDGLIDYIDISSVDNTEKKIVSFQTIHAKDAPSRAKQLLKQGDVIVSTVRPNLNAVAIVTNETENLMVGSTGYCVLRCKEKLDAHYLFNFCQSQYFIDNMSSQATGASYPAVNASIVRNSLIPWRPIEKQREIAKKLNAVGRLIFLRKQQLVKLDELVKARFVELFGEWKSKPEPLKSFLEDITYGFTNPMPDAEEGPWKVTAKDVVNGKVNYDTARKTTVQAYEELTAKSKPAVGDVLLTKDGTLGRCAVVEEDGICVNQSVAVLKCNRRILPKFLAILLQMPEYQREMLKNAGGGTIKHIYITKVVDMLIVVPTISQQLEFLSFVEQTDKLQFDNGVFTPCYNAL